MEFEIAITGAEESRKRVERLSQRMDSIAREKIEDQLELITAMLEGEVKGRTPTDTGTLRSSIFHEVRTKGIASEALVSTPLVYGPPMEFGRRLGAKQPPAEALKSWARRKLGDEKLVYVVARAIKRKGIKAQRMFRDAWAQNLGRVSQLLEEIGVHVSEELLRQL